MKLCKLLASSIIILVAIFVCMMVLPMEVDAADYGTCGTNLTWNINDEGTLTISGAGAMENYSYNSNSPTRSTHPWKNIASSVKAVVIEEGITSVGDYAFYNCMNLTSVTIPDSVISIGNYSFYYCTSLTSVTIPDSVTSIGDYSFYYCTSLTSLTIGKGVTNIGNYAFSYGRGLTNLIIPDGVTSVGNYAFYECSNLTSIIIPDSVISIGGGAFYHCTSLTSVTIGNGVTNIGDNVFFGCRSLTDVTIPDSVTSIGYAAFAGCSSLSNLIIPDSVTSIGGSAFYHCTSLTSVTIGDGVTSIEKKTFYECINLTSVTIGNSVTSIGNAAFQGCDYLTSVTIPDSVISIGEDAFRHCDRLKSVTIGNGVTNIGDYAFYYCTSLKSVTIGNGVTSIGLAAFYRCTSLTEVHISDIVAWCGIHFEYLAQYGITSNPIHYANKLYLNGDLVTDLVIPDSVTSIRDFAFYYCTSLTSLTIGDGVTRIGDRAFWSCTGLTSVTIGNSVTEICPGAFYNCSSLPSIIIPDNVTNISNHVFWKCTNLTSVIIPDGITNVGKEVFAECSKLAYNEYDGAKYLGNASNPYVVLWELKANDVTSCVVHPDTKLLADSSFRDCTSLTSVVIGDDVAFVGDEAFYNCTGLKVVMYKGSRTDWQNVAIDINNSALQNAKIFFDFTGNSVADLIFTVEFRDWNGELITSEYYHYGDIVAVPASPFREADGDYAYTFMGWNKEVTECTDDATYVAVYSRQLAVAEVNGTKYGTLVQAIAKANGNEITLLKSTSGAALEITVDTIINFGEYTYTVNTPVDDLTKAAVTIDSEATLTLNGTGGLYSRYSNRDLFSTLILNNGKLIVNGVTLVGNNLRAADCEHYTIKNASGSAEATINSGAVIGNPVNTDGETTKGVAAIDVLAPEGYCWNTEGKLAEHTHNIVTVVGATTTTIGYMEHKCVCGDSYRSDEFTYNRCVAAVGNYGFRTVQEAIDNANGGVVTLLRSHSGSALKITEDTVIDFAGLTYTVNTPAAGTNAAVIVASEAALTLTGNGALYTRYSNKALFDTLIQNEGNLVLEDVQLYGKNLDKADVCNIVAGQGAVDLIDADFVLNDNGTTNGVPEVA